jgi:hypothetical protein
MNAADGPLIARTAKSRSLTLRYSGLGWHQSRRRRTAARQRVLAVLGGPQQRKPVVLGVGAHSFRVAASKTDFHDPASATMASG